VTKLDRHWLTVQPQLQHIKTLTPKMSPKAANEAEAIKRSWAEDVGPKMQFMQQQQRKRQFHSGSMLCRRSVLCGRSTEGCMKRTYCSFEYIKTQASTGHIQAYPSKFRHVEAPSINHVHRGTMMHHVSTCHISTIHLKTKIGKHHLHSADCDLQCAT
jgi:hypothetical protein